MPTSLVDLSHPVSAGMRTYAGLPVPEISTVLERSESRKHYAAGTEFRIASVRLCGNTGTYVDAPSHRYAGARDIAALPLECVANLEGVRIPAGAGERRIHPDDLSSVNVADRAVLIHTDWARHWGSDRYFSGHPFLSEEAALYLAKAGAALVGIDSYNIDDTADPWRPAHSILLQHGIPIVEHMTNLGALGGHEFRFFAVPAPICGMDSFTVRAFAILDPGKQAHP